MNSGAIPASNRPKRRETQESDQGGEEWIASV